MIGCRHWDLAEALRQGETERKHQSTECKLYRGWQHPRLQGARRSLPIQLLQGAVCSCSDAASAVQFRKDKSDTPSNFTLKLRKHVRTRRLEDVRQLGVDRVVDFTFGSGEATYHIILELYSQARLGLTMSPRVDLASGRIQDTALEQASFFWSAMLGNCAFGMIRQTICRC